MASDRLLPLIAHDRVSFRRNHRLEWFGLAVHEFVGLRPKQVLDVVGHLVSRRFEPWVHLLRPLINGLHRVWPFFPVAVGTFLCGGLSRFSGPIF